MLGQAPEDGRPLALGGQAGDRPGEARGAKAWSRRESGRARQRRQRQAEFEQSPLYALKVEAARALGLWVKVQAEGWGSLSAVESGRLGGYVTRMQRLRGGRLAVQRDRVGGPGGTDASG